MCAAELSVQCASPVSTDCCALSQTYTHVAMAMRKPQPPAVTIWTSPSALLQAAAHGVKALRWGMPATQRYAALPFQLNMVD